MILTRSSHRGQILTFFTEIDRIERRLRRLKRNQEVANSALPNISDTEIFMENTRGMDAKTLKDFATPNLNRPSHCIELPAPKVQFELKSGLIHLLPSFYGNAGEDPNKHLKEFHVVCIGMKPHGVTEEQVKLKAFPFSLRTKVRIDVLFTRRIDNHTDGDTTVVLGEILSIIESNQYSQRDMWGETVIWKNTIRILGAIQATLYELPAPSDPRSAPDTVFL